MPAERELTLLVVLTGSVRFEADAHEPVVLANGSSVAVPAGTTFTLADPSDDCELLEVALPGTPVLLPESVLRLAGPRSRPTAGCTGDHGRGHRRT